MTERAGEADGSRQRRASAAVAPGRAGKMLPVRGPPRTGRSGVQGAKVALRVRIHRGFPCLFGDWTSHRAAWNDGHVTRRVLLAVCVLVAMACDSEAGGTRAAGAGGNGGSSSSGPWCGPQPPVLDCGPCPTQVTCLGDHWGCPDWCSETSAGPTASSVSGAGAAGGEGGSVELVRSVGTGGELRSPGGAGGMPRDAGAD